LAHIKSLINRLYLEDERVSLFGISFSFLLLIYISLYSYYFPSFLGNSLSYMVAVFTYAAVMSYLSIISDTKYAHLILLNLTIHAFLIAVLYCVETPFPFLDDPYYYFTSVLNIMRTGSLNPVLSDWHWIVSLLPYYPTLHTWTASVLLIIGVPPSIVSIRFATILIAFLNALVPLLTYMFCKFATKNVNISLLSATIMSSGFMFFQYHEQYMAIVLYLVLFSTLFRKEPSFRFLVIVSIISFSMVHRASILIILLLLLFQLTCLVPSSIKRLSSRNEINFLVLGVVLMLTNLTITYIGFLRGIISESTYFFSDPFTNYLLEGSTGSVGLSSQSSLAIIYGYFSYSKFLILITSLCGLMLIMNLKSKNRDSYNLYIRYYLSFLILTIIGGLIKLESMCRFLLFFYLFMSLFSAIFIFKFSSSKLNFKKGIFIIMIGIIIGSNTLYNIPLQFFDAESHAVPPMDEYFNAGRWLYTNDNSNYYVVGAGLRHIPDYFGEKSSSKIRSIEYYIDNGKVDFKINVPFNSYTLILSKKFYGGYLSNFYCSLNTDLDNLLSTSNLVYNSGEIIITKT
jgi:hypothetical protein